VAILAYARVSTADQDLDGQIAALTAAGATTIYQEKISGIRSDRAELANLLGALQSGDTLLVTRLDRLARSTLDLLGILKRVDDVGAKFRSLADQWCDMTTAHGKLMVTILGGLADFERSLILARTGEGRKRAKEAGKRLGGRKPENMVMKPEQRVLALARLQAGATASGLAKEYGVHRSTIARLRG
jgi:DNA invertase Pin-like site-specific DNA recombinase